MYVLSMYVDRMDGLNNPFPPNNNNNPASPPNERTDSKPNGGTCMLDAIIIIITIVIIIVVIVTYGVLYGVLRWYSIYAWSKHLPSARNFGHMVSQWGIFLLSTYIHNPTVTKSSQDYLQASTGRIQSTYIQSTPYIHTPSVQYSTYSVHTVQYVYIQGPLDRGPCRICKTRSLTRWLISDLGFSHFTRNIVTTE